MSRMPIIRDDVCAGCKLLVEVTNKSPESSDGSDQQGPEALDWLRGSSWLRKAWR